MKSAISIAFIKDLLQEDYDGRFYDFHNDYNCGALILSDKVLLIQLIKRIDGSEISMKFNDVEISRIEFFNVKEVAFLTLDSLYRGRFETDGKLIELSEDGKGYFYMEFYEGQKLEFWATSLEIIEKQS